VIPLCILPAQVGKQPSSLPHQLKQATLRVVVMPISRHVPGQLVYPLGKHRYLNLNGTGITFTKLKLIYDFCLFNLIQTTFPFYKITAPWS
jgi:hypothetical protein